MTSPCPIIPHSYILGHVLDQVVYFDWLLVQNIQGGYRGIRPLSITPILTVDIDCVEPDCVGDDGVLEILALAIAAELPRNRLRISSYR